MKIILITYIGLTILLILDAVLYFSHGISLPGHYGDWLLFWAWIISTIVIISLNIRRFWIRVYTFGLLGFIVLTMIPMMIPFIIIFAFATDTKDIRYPINKEVALTENFRSPMTVPNVVAIKSYGFYEKIVGSTDFDFSTDENSYRIQDATSIRQLNSAEAGDSLRVEFKFENSVVIRTF